MRFAAIAYLSVIASFATNRGCHIVTILTADDRCARQLAATILQSEYIAERIIDVLNPALPFRKAQGQ